MALNDLLIDELEMTHLFTLDNKTVEEDGVTTNYPTRINNDDGSKFVWDDNPCCEGFTYAPKTNDSTSYSSRSNGVIFDNSDDINKKARANYGDVGKTIGMWTRVNQVLTPSCILDEGAQVNNFAFFVGLGQSFTWQAADDGQPFLIAQSKLKAQAGRNYLLTGTWEYQRNGYNAIDFFVNGVLQETVQLTGTDKFPDHGGDINIGNTDDDLKSYNEGVIKSAIREKWANLFFIKNLEIWDETIIREIFERTTFAEVTIEADTVKNQQAALDNLIGNSYFDVNCAIRIVQATDTTNYTLLMDDITFKRVDELRDIHIQFLGEGELHIENCNGSNAYELSTPKEIERVSDTLVGGGSLTKTDNSVRLKDDSDYNNHIIDGNLWIDCDSDVTIDMENVNVAGKVYNRNNDATVTIRATACELEADIAGSGNGQVNIEIVGELTITGLVDGTEVRLYDVNMNELFGIEESSGNVVCDYVGMHTDALLVAYHVLYHPIRVKLNLNGDKASIPMSQAKDTTYYNP